MPRHEFYGFFRELSTIYEILSPDAFLRPFVEDFETLGRFFKVLKEAYEPGTPIDRDFTRKTAKLVQEHTESGRIKSGLGIYEINEDTLKLIEESNATDTEKVFNLLKSVVKAVPGNALQNPYLISIGERAEEIARRFHLGQINTQETLEALKHIIDEINAAQRERAEKDMSGEVFTAYWLMKREALSKPEDNANRLKDAFDEYPHWKTSEAHAREVRKKLYKVLVDAGLKKPVELGKKIMDVLKRSMGQ